MPDRPWEDLPDDVLCVGREEQLAQLLSAAEPNRQGAVVLTGEAGIGKSTLLEALMRALGGRGVTVVTGSGDQVEMQLPFTVLRDVLLPLYAEFSAGLPAPQRRALGRALLVDEEDGAEPAPQAVAAATAGIIQAAGGAQPLVVVLDDMQWVDAGSAQALRYALRRRHTGRFAVVMARRAGYEDAVVGGISASSGVEVMEVSPLSLGAIKVILAERLGVRLPLPQLIRLHEVSGGNPFFALELARGLIRDRSALVAGDGLRLPASLTDIVRSRLDALDREGLSACRAAAVAGPHSDRRLVAQISSERGVGEAVDAGVLVDRDGLRFDHPLLAEGALATASESELRDLHARLAHLAVDPVDRVRHQALAVAGQSAEVAAGLEEGAKHAAGRGAPVIAAEMLELAIDRSTPGESDAIIRRRCRAADLMIRAGAPDRARELLEPLFDELGFEGVPIEALMLMWHARADDLATGGRLLEMALRRAGGDPSREIGIRSVLGVHCLVVGALDEGRMHAARELELAREFGSSAQLAAAAFTWILVETLGGVRVPRAAVDEALALDCEGVFPAWQPAVSAGCARMYYEQLDEALALLRVAYLRAEALGDDTSRVGILLHMVEAECRAGDFAAARGYADEQLELTELAGSNLHDHARALYASALVDAHVGDPASARDRAGLGVRTAQAVYDVAFAMQNRVVLGITELSVGDHHAAAAHLRTVPPEMEERGFHEPSWCPALPNAVEALAGTGELDLAAEYADRLAQLGLRLESPWAAALGARCQGIVAAAAGDEFAAVEAFDAAEELHVAVASEFERARTLLVRGVADRRFKRRGAARARLTEAHGIFAGCGADTWAATAAAELRRVGGRQSSSTLTPTEERVARLVADGLANREVAAELFVSVRAVESSLTRVYAKLGVRSRTELAARFASGGF